MSAAEPFDAFRVPLEGTNVVEASAGTGKTHAITTLAVRLIVERGLSVRDVLIVTFTEAATSELRGRVRDRLSQAVRAFARVEADILSDGLSEGPPGDLDAYARDRQDSARADRRRLELALRDVDDAAISTIHGFCHRMLAETAFESGVAFDTEMLTDGTALRDDVVADYFAAHVSTLPLEQVVALEAARVKPSLLRGLVDRVSRDPRLPVEPASAPPTDPVRTKLDLIDFVRTELPRRKQAASLLGFDDLLHRVRDALASPTGARLSAMIRERHPAALIDEFQDTDPEQYEIFHRVYASPRLADDALRDPVLFLIGDPKQAIYSFRGADIFAYLAAVARGGNRRYTMGTNHRSDPDLVRAVGHIFGRRPELARPFLLDGIEQPPVVAAGTARDVFVPAEPFTSAPMDVLFVRSKEGKGPSRDDLPDITAADIACLLDSGAALALTTGTREVTAADIAVLTRRNLDGFAVQSALARHGIASVVMGDRSVFDTEEARELRRVLAGVLEPVSPSALRRALATDLLGLGGPGIASLETDPATWELWTERFRHWNVTWTEKGFVQMFESLLELGDVQRRALAHAGGERRMTNLLHLMELLHQATRESHLGPTGLLAFLDAEVASPPNGGLAPEHVQIRLESDEAAVKITTIHRAKGLEFPIVYCPYLGSGMLTFPGESRELLFHDAEGNLKLDVGSPRFELHRSRTRRENLAESLRLAYVALTRARHRTTIVWGKFKGVDESALAYLLAAPSPLPDDVDAIVKHLRRLSEGAWLEAVRARAMSSEGAIGWRLWEHDAAVPRRRPALSLVPALAPRALERTIDRRFRTASFSALAAVEETSHVHPAAAEPGEPRDGRDRDDVDAPTVTVTAPADSLPLAAFPRGARAGTFFHEVLEKLDFQQRAELPVAVREGLRAHGFPAEPWADVVSTALGEILDTPLPPLGCALSDIPRSRRLVELEFHVPVRSGKRMPLTPAELAQVFREHPSAEVPPAYCDRLARLRFVPVHGFLKGYIDLVFQHGQRFYVLDWKTNHLGVAAGDYHAGNLAAAMSSGHYVLQYHLYCLAVHRHLARTMPGYSYDRHFGGALYLFLRGLRGHGAGVFFERPPEARMEALSAIFVEPARRGPEACP
jgi:exodeoxyribonuclease V beta subunit